MSYNLDFIRLFFHSCFFIFNVFLMDLLQDYRIKSLHFKGNCLFHYGTRIDKCQTILIPTFLKTTRDLYSSPTGIFPFLAENFKIRRFLKKWFEHFSLPIKNIVHYFLLVNPGGIFIPHVYAFILQIADFKILNFKF